MNDIELTNEQLESVAGGSDTKDIKFNLNNYAYKTVTVPMGTLLVMQESPGGAFMSTYYSDGEPNQKVLRVRKNAGHFLFGI